MMPIAVSENISYAELSHIIKTVGSEIYTSGQNLRGLWARWERNDRSSPFPERTRIHEENLKATLGLMMLRHGRDVLEADCE